MKMSRVRKVFAVVVLSVGVSVGGVVIAQPEPDDHTAEADVSMKKRANISPRDMVNQAADYLEKMKETLRHVVGLQEVARRGKDVIKLNCVNDKLLQVKQLMNIAEAANTNLSEAIARNDEEGRYHEFGRITIAQQQVAVLGTEAENCIGEDLSFLGPTEVTVDAPEEPEDPTVSPDPTFPIVEPLPVASPFI